MAVANPPRLKSETNATEIEFADRPALLDLKVTPCEIDTTRKSEKLFGDSVVYARRYRLAVKIAQSCEDPRDLNEDAWDAARTLALAARSRDRLGSPGPSSRYRWGRPKPRSANTTALLP